MKTQIALHLLLLCVGFLKAQDIPYIEIEKSGNKCNITQHNLLPINCDQPVYLVVHGWVEGVTVKSFDKLVKELLAKNYTSYFVDWHKIARSIYHTTDVHFVGKCLGEYLNATIYQKCPKPYVYIAGHSLGAHVAGIAGKTLKTSGFLPDVIVGLDPAGPNFYIGNRRIRLNRNDAKLVVHLQTSMWGMVENLGKVMFSANDGIRQSGCPFHSIIPDIKEVVSCSHHRSVDYLSEAVTSNNFVACKCEKLFGMIVLRKNCKDTLIFNLDIPLSANGTYCFATKSTPPYGKGKIK